MSEIKYLLIVVTNQPDVARGWVSREAVDMIHNKIKEFIHIDDIKICFHTDQDQCECRKPRPGMLLPAISDWNINVEAGKSAGCKTILIGEGDHSSDIKPDFRKNSRLEAAKLMASMN